MARQIRKYTLVITKDIKSGIILSAKMEKSDDGIWYYHKDVAPYIKEPRPKPVRPKRAAQQLKVDICRQCTGECSVNITRFSKGSSVSERFHCDGKRSTVC